MRSCPPRRCHLRDRSPPHRQSAAMLGRHAAPPAAPPPPSMEMRTASARASASAAAAAAAAAAVAVGLVVEAAAPVPADARRPGVRRGRPPRGRRRRRARVVRRQFVRGHDGGAHVDERPVARPARANASSMAIARTPSSELRSSEALRGCGRTSPTSCRPAGTRADPRPPPPPPPARWSWLPAVTGCRVSRRHPPILPH